MRLRVVVLLCLAMSIPAFAQELRSSRAQEHPVAQRLDVPFTEMMSRVSAVNAPRRISPDVVLEGAEFGFIFPVTGSAGVFRTETVMVNRRNRRQNVALYYMPIAGGSPNCNLPGVTLTFEPNAMYLYTDFVPEVFGKRDSFGSVVVLAVDSNGNIDQSALIDGNSRIWSLAPGGGTASQNFPSMSLQIPTGEQSAFGLRSDEFYRTNWGIFNYDSVARVFDILFTGFRGSDTIITREIPPCSLIQSPVTGGPYGSLEIVFAPRDGGGMYYAYGSTVDNASSDSFSVPARK